VSRIDITIDRIVLSGIDTAHRDALLAGLREGLARSLSEPSPYTPRSTPVVRISDLTLEPGHAGARRLGGGIGQALGRATR
jgi:hypothetical protein